jgi:hypothetical protein
MISATTLKPPPPSGKLEVMRDSMKQEMLPA